MISSDINLRRLSLSGLFGLGWLIFKRNLGKIIFLLIIMCMPLNIIISSIAGYSDFFILLLFIKYILSAVIIVALSRIVESEFEGKDITLSGALRCGWARFGKVVWTGIIDLLVGIVLSILIIPGLLWYIDTLFFPYVVSFKGLNGSKALEYSRSITNGNRWRTIGTYLFFFVIFSFILFLLSGIDTVITLSSFRTTETYFFSFGLLVFSLLDGVCAFFSILLAVFFLNNDLLKKNTLI